MILLIIQNSDVDAWKILDKLYGNKTLLANKLKSKLKGIKVAGKESYDIIINLAVEVKSIVKSLTEMKMQDMLRYDDEYLSSIFRILPEQYRNQWLEYNKDDFSSLWEAMESFIEVIHEKATNTKILLTSYGATGSGSSMVDGIKCHKCNKTGHKKSQCNMSDVKVGATKVTHDSESDDDDSGTSQKLKQEISKLKRKAGNCPSCKVGHVYTRKRDGLEVPADRFSACDVFRSLSERERGEMLEKHNACARCTSWLHVRSSRDCKAPKSSCSNNLANGVRCKSDHSKMVCGSGVVYCASANLMQSNASINIAAIPDLTAETMMLLQDVKVKTGNLDSSARVLWDKGSNRVLIRHSFAKRHKLRAHKVDFKISVVGSVEKYEKGIIYELDLVDKFDCCHRIWGFGMEEIMDAPLPVNLDPIRHLFPHIPDEAFATLPRKPIDLLIGLNFLSLHPDGGQGINSVGNIKVYNSIFSNGWLVAGAHPLLNVNSSRMTAAAASIVRVNKVEVRPVLGNRSLAGSYFPYSQDFWESDAMGVLPPKRCCRCLSCPECKDSALILSRKEQDELEMMKKSIKLENGELIVTYPFIKNPECFPNNREAAIKMAIKQELKLEKRGMLDKYNEELFKYISRGIVVPITKHEMEDYIGPVNYISHHAVEKPSPTTPFRIVTNSSLRNGIRSLNDCLPKGPNGLNSMFDVMIRFRCYEIGLVFDLTKAYNSLKTGLVEKHLRRLIWRFCKEDDWQDFGFVVVAFGDRPAANFLELGKALAADAGGHIDPSAAKKIKMDSYVDDHVTGGSFADVQRMVGERMDDGSYTGTVCRIFAKGNLKVKVMVASGENNEEVKELLGNKVLGYQWDSTSDMMSFFPLIPQAGYVKLNQSLT